MAGILTPFKADALWRRLAATCSACGGQLGIDLEVGLDVGTRQEKDGCGSDAKTIVQWLGAPRTPSKLEKSEAHKDEGRNDRPSVTHDPSPCSMSRDPGPTRRVALRRPRKGDRCTATRAEYLCQAPMRARCPRQFIRPPAKPGRSICRSHTREVLSETSRLRLSHRAPATDSSHQRGHEDSAASAYVHIY